MSRPTRTRSPVDDWNNNGHLWAVAARMKQVHIEQDDALKVIQRYDEPGTLFYIDPPYVQSTRGKRWESAAYRHEMTEEKHRELAEVLQDIAGMAIVSGYPSDLYDELYAGWETDRRKIAKDNGVRAAVECLWISQLRLFDAKRKL